MAKGYATIENDGAYRDPTCILKITDSEGTVIYQPNRNEEIVYQEEAAREMTDILQGVLIRGTGVGLGLGDMPCAGKTGTTNDSKDGWFVGYTPYYTTSVWVGYDTPRTLSGLYGATYPGRIWHNFMTSLHEGLEPRDFPQPANNYYVPEEPVEEAPAEEITNEEDGALDAAPDGAPATGPVVEEGVDEVWEDGTGAPADEQLGEIVQPEAAEPIEEATDAADTGAAAPIEEPAMDTGGEEVPVQ